MHRIWIVIVLCLASSGCDSCADAPSWDLREFDTPADVCEDALAFVTHLQILDQNTLARAPSGLVGALHEDVGDDGIIDRCWLRFYDDKNRLVLSLVNYSGAQSGQYMHWVQEFDERFDEPIRYTTDSDGDGVFESPGWSEYGDDGKILRSGNSLGEGRFFYDTNGFRTRQERWENGVLVSYTNFETDAAGRYLAWRTDVDADGEIDRIQTWTYEGDVVVEQTESVREVQSGEWFVTRHTNTLDAQGRIVGWQADVGDDGVVDYESTTVWDGDTETMFLDHDADGTSDYREVTVWQQINGLYVRLSIREDHGNNGTWNHIRLYAYDDAGRHLHYRVQDPSTGKILHRQSTIYN